MDSIRVLIVDDEAQFVDAVVERLGLRAFEAHGVTNGNDALQALQESSYDVVLLDVKMPGLGGLEVITQIKENWPSLQVVLLTGHGSSKDAEDGMRIGAYQYVMKPVKIDELVRILLEASEQSGATGDE